MKTVDVKTTDEAVADGLRLVIGFIVYAGDKSEQLNPEFNMLNLLPMLIGIPLLAYF